jgi:hypothetical protein
MQVDELLDLFPIKGFRSATVRDLHGSERATTSVSGGG